MNTKTVTAQNCSLFEIDAELEETFDQLQRPALRGGMYCVANEANITLFTTSRLLNQWQRAGLLVKSYGKILLRSPERLLRHEQ